MNEIFAPGQALADAIEQVAGDLRDRSRSHIVFVVAESFIVRREAIAELAERLSGDYAMREFDYRRANQLSLPRFCRTLRDDLPVCVFATGLPELRELDREKYETALTLLNNHREDLQLSPCALILWLTQQARGDLIEQAPDFADWRTTEAALTLPSGTRIKQTPLAALPIEEAEQFRHQARRIEQMLARPNLSQALAADFRKQLAHIYRQLGCQPLPSQSPEWWRIVLSVAGDSTLAIQASINGALPSDISTRLAELAKEGDAQELMRQLNPLLENNSLRMALAATIYSRRERFLKQFLSHGVSTDSKQLIDFARSTALGAYRGDIIQEYRYAQQRGIEGLTSIRDHTFSPLLDDIYIQPRLLSSRELATGRDRENFLLRALDDHDLSRSDRVRLEEEFALISGERWRPGKIKEEVKGFSIGEALGPARHAVVIGGPGVGKSVLTRYLALKCAAGVSEMNAIFGWPADSEELTPIIVSLARFADARGRGECSALRDFIDRMMSDRGGEALRQAIAEEAIAGRVFFLFDGVDEVPGFDRRSAVAQAMEEFIQNHEANRFLVTSRPYGYIPLQRQAEHFQLPNFDSEQVADFIRKWQRAFEQFRHPQSPNLSDAAKQAEAMITEINSNPKVAELAGNPLMLVIIALIRYEQARLPQQRVQLYNRAVNTLMDTWNSWRSQLAGVDLRQQLKIDELVIVWANIAEWTRREKPTGVVHRSELKRRLVEVLVAEGLDDGKPEATAESYLLAAADRAGLLEERGPDVFAFWHPTFEEFLAAVKLTTPTKNAIKNLLPLRDDPRWREVILLAAGYAGIVVRDRDTATDIIEALSEGDGHTLEPLLHGHLRLAAACVADDIGVKRGTVEKIVVRLAEAIQTHPYAPMTTAFVQTVRSLPRLRPSPETVDSLALLVKHRDWEVRMESTRWISNVAVENKNAHRLCEELFKDQDPDVRCHAAVGLIRTGNYRSEIWEALTRFVFDDDLTHLEYVLEEFVSLPNQAFDGLLSVLSAEEPWLRVQAATLLREWGRADSQLIGAIRSVLAAKDDGLHFEAVELLREWGRTDPQLSDAIRSWLAAEEPWLRVQAARLLRECGQTDSQLTDALRSVLAVEEPDLRVQAASLLRKWEQTDPQLIDSLRSVLTVEESWLRFEAAEPLREWGQTDPQLIDAIRSWLAAENPWLRFEAAKLLHEWEWTNPQLIDAIRSTLDAENPWLRFEAAKLLREWGQSDPQLIDAIRSVLTAEAPRLRFEAAKLLREWGQSDPQLIDAIRPWLAAENPWLRFQAANLLREWRRQDPQLIDALRSVLTCEDPELRFEAANLLQEIAERNNEVVTQIARLIIPDPLEALAACRRIARQEPVLANDVAALVEITRIREDDTDQQSTVREWLFEWLWRRLEPKARQESTADGIAT